MIQLILCQTHYKQLPASSGRTELRHHTHPRQGRAQHSAIHVIISPILDIRVEERKPRWAPDASEQKCYCDGGSHIGDGNPKLFIWS